MKQCEINNMEDLFIMLDDFTEGIKWDRFYTERNKPAPFIKNNRIPDKCIVEFIEKYQLKTAIEFGCGEGRNAIYLAKQGVTVDAIDLSDVAIKTAANIALEDKVENVAFEAVNIFKKDFSECTYDFAIDSGMFHHLAPHRRLSYKEILKSVVKKQGYFILLCFAENENVADEVDDYEFYKSRRVGVAFSEERLRHFFTEDFEIIQIKKGEDICSTDEIEYPYLYKCLMKRR